MRRTHFVATALGVVTSACVSAGSYAEVQATATVLGRELQVVADSGTCVLSSGREQIPLLPMPPCFFVQDELGDVQTHGLEGDVEGRNQAGHVVPGRGSQEGYSVRNAACAYLAAQRRKARAIANDQEMKFVAIVPFEEIDHPVQAVPVAHVSGKAQNRKVFEAQSFLDLGDIQRDVEAPQVYGIRNNHDPPLGNARSADMIGENVRDRQDVIRVPPRGLLAPPGQPLQGDPAVAISLVEKRRIDFQEVGKPEIALDPDTGQEKQVRPLVQNVRLVGETGLAKLTVGQ